MSSTVALAAIMGFSAIAAIAMFVHEIKQFLNGEGRYATDSPNTE